MDSPSFPAGRSAPDAHAAEPVAARPALEVVPGPARSPAQRPARPLASAPPEPSAPAPAFDLESLVTEDDTPVDNMPSEKQQRLLTEPLYSSWAGPGAGRPFLAAANVGVFPEPRNPAIVPDVFLSLDVQVNPDWWDTRHRSYFVWEFGKVPDLVVEVVSNQKGNEIGGKRLRYARMGVGYYVIQDLFHRVMRDDLRVYRLSGRRYVRQGRPWFPELRLGMTLWEGLFEGVRSRWLRWTDAHGELIPTGKEAAERERGRAEQERRRAEQEHGRAEQERQRADRLAAVLRRAGIDPEQA